MQRADAYNGNPIEYISGDYVYKELDDGTVEITDYTGTDSTITIPSELGGKTVTNIGKYAFGYCTSLKSVTIPKSVTKIDKQAFGYNGNEKIDGFTIKCYKGTAAETYAKENGFKIEYIGLKHIAAKAATCTTDGNIEYWKHDGKFYSDEGLTTEITKAKTIVKATGHKWGTPSWTWNGTASASAYNAPLLLATDKIATKQTEAELARLNAKNVIIVSTNGAVGTAVTKALSKYKPAVISGKNYFETAANVAKALQTKTNKAPDTIFFATDGAFADALSASPVAAIKGAPIIYLKKTGSIDTATANYLKTVKGKVKNAYIIGGSGAISDEMMKNAASALGLTVNITVQRLWGANRYETCAAVNNTFKSVLSSTGICVAKGLDFPDALAGGVYAAKTKQALFLADGKKLLDAQNSYLKGKNASKITVFGGTGAVPDELVKLIAKASV